MFYKIINEIKKVIKSLFLLIGTIFFTGTAFARTDINLFNTNHTNSTIPLTTVTNTVRSYFYIDQYRAVAVQVINNAQHNPDHILVYLFSKKYHRVDVARMDINANYQVINVIRHYQLTRFDFSQQPGVNANHAVCPDPSIQFIAFAPNNNDLEQNITKEVADNATAHHLKTILLTLDQATRENYLNYMSCPHLVGNFYDGDADPTLITTVDGVISASDIQTNLAKKFRYKVTNIWLACEAYNDPMKSVMLNDAESQKYAAGIDDLLIGPSDKVAACTMEAAMGGQPETDSFQACYKKLDDPSDQWGFGGNGSDYFGQ